MRQKIQNILKLNVGKALGICLISILLSLTGNAQVGINILVPDTSAVLQLESTEKGFLPPRMTTAQRDVIFQPADGLVIYNTTDSTVQYYNGVCWLRTFQRTCNDCFFNLSSSSTVDTIDRVITDSVAFQLTVNQVIGTPQNIGFTVVTPLPLGMTYDIIPNPILGSGTVDVTFYVTTFTPHGTYPIIIQAVCGGSVQNFVYSLTILPCYEVNVLNNAINYDLATDLYATYPSLPTTQPVCVISNVDKGVLITSDTAITPAYTTGNLPTGSVVAIVNDGNIIGRGGNGGIGEDSNLGITGEGAKGADAINLTAKTYILNNFNIYGGGGGGNAMAFAISQALGPITLGIFIGSGGGGGAGDAIGGREPGGINISVYQGGQDATGGQFGVPGVGGLLTYPVSFPVGPVDVDIEPNVRGGDGGAYGFPGTQGSFFVELGATVNVGPFPIPIGPFPVQIPVPIPPAGDAGFAVKRNSNVLNIPDNNYNTSFLKGRIGN